MKNVKLIVAATFIVAATCLLGCGKDEGYRMTTGKVTMDGQPVAGAMLVFYPEASDGESGSGMTDENGAYKVTCAGSSKGEAGLKPGTYKVTVAKYADHIDPDETAYQNGEITYDELQEKKAKRGTVTNTKMAELLTPKQYSATGTTPLSITVTDNPKDNVFDFNLE